MSAETCGDVYKGTMDSDEEEEVPFVMRRAEPPLGTAEGSPCADRVCTQNVALSLLPR